MSTYIPALFFIGMMISGQQEPVLGIPMTLLCAWGFVKTAKRLPV